MEPTCNLLQARSPPGGHSPGHPSMAPWPPGQPIHLCRRWGGGSPSYSSWRQRLLPFCLSDHPLPNCQRSAAMAQTPHQVALSHLPSPKPPPAAMTSLSLVRMRPRHRPMMERHCHRPQGSPSDFSLDWKKNGENVVLKGWCLQTRYSKRQWHTRKASVPKTTCLALVPPVRQHRTPVPDWVRRPPPPDIQMRPRLLCS